MAAARPNEDMPTPGPDVAGWLSEIEKAEKDMSRWTKRCDSIRKRYLYESSSRTTRRRYQMLWANQEILRPSVYAKRPDPSVQSRFKDGNPVSRIACELLERTLDYQFDAGNYDATFRAVRDDYLLYGRGVPRLRYEAVFDKSEVYEGNDGEDSWGKEGDGPEEDGDPAYIIQNENVRLDFVNRMDFIHPDARRWEELPWLAYRAYMDRLELIERFKDVGKDIPLDAKSPDRKEDTPDSASDKATVFEIWDKRRRRVLWIAKGYPDILEDNEPYLKFDGFYPSPCPAYGTISTESLQPVPDFVFYQDQAEEIDDLTARIASLTDSLKLVGFYPAGPSGEGSPEIETAVKAGVENKMIAVKSWAVFKEGGGGGAPIVWLPIEQVAKIIEACVKLRKELINDVFQITGIADIMRGDTDAEETAAAQGIKAQWGNIRLRERQKEIARVARDVTRMAAEIIAGQFQIQTMLDIASMSLPTDAEVAQKKAQFQQQQMQYQQMVAQAQQAQHMQVPGGQPPQPGMPPQPPAPAPQLPPPPQWQDPGPTQEQVEKLLRDGVMRRYLIDIESDSTIAADQQAEQQKRVQFIGEVGKFLVSMAPIAQEQPALMPLIGAMLKFGVRAFPVGRELEETIEQTVDKMVAQSGQQQKPNPEQLKAQAMQAKSQIEIQKAHLGMQTEQMRAQAEMQKAHMDSQADIQAHQMDMQRAGLEAQQAQADHSMQMQQHAMKQRTLEQTMAQQEQKMVAREALQMFHPPVPGAVPGRPVR